MLSVIETIQLFIYVGASRKKTILAECLTDSRWSILLIKERSEGACKRGLHGRERREGKIKSEVEME